MQNLPGQAPRSGFPPRKRLNNGGYGVYIPLNSIEHPNDWGAALQDIAGLLGVPYYYESPEAFKRKSEMAQAVWNWLTGQ
jgi:hypothetical protein